MSDQKRASLGLHQEEKDPITLEQLTGSMPREPISPEQDNEIRKVGKAMGFVSRQPSRRRRRSPYTAQFGGKCREGMKQLFQEVAERLDMRDTEALEEAVLALIEKKEFDDLKKKFMEIVK